MRLRFLVLLAALLVLPARGETVTLPKVKFQTPHGLKQSGQPLTMPNGTGTWNWQDESKARRLTLNVTFLGPPKDLKTGLPREIQAKSRDNTVVPIQLAGAEGAYEAVAKAANEGGLKCTSVVAYTPTWRYEWIFWGAASDKGLPAAIRTMLGTISIK